ncbi:hypothetical protein Cflav_PD1071 [Pedosphaera parvula Ellin514]|uniref:Uncharacterized protein n=2 Tax=Pedosphaera TaxID=1032526 RepID=B9XNY2_PEDPL|nr:hypothetical protein Cflav_PD1071 [Pedosphaera parvula Ellin514]
MGLFDGTSRVIIRVLPENREWMLYSEDAVAGWRLLQLDAPHKRALIMHGTNVLMASMPSSVTNKDQLATFVSTGVLPPDYIGPWPQGYEPEIIRLHRAGLLSSETNSAPIEKGLKVSGQYIGALRGYAKTLPDAEAAPIQRELERYSAGSLVGGPEIQESTLKPVETFDTSYPTPLLSSTGETSSLLQRVLNHPPPEVGSLIGTGTDSQVPELRQLVRNQSDPQIALRLRQELDGYAAPPIANYNRDASGQWNYAQSESLK